VRAALPRGALTRGFAIGALAYAPIALAVAIDRLALARLPPMARDLSIHARCLVAVPLLVVAEVLLGRLVARISTSLAREGVIAPDELPRLDALLARVRRVHRSPLLTIALALVTGIGAARWWLVDANAATPSAARWAYVFATLPISLFVAGRLIAAWALWCATLVGIARLRLTPLVLHADRVGGLLSLALPTGAFAVGVVGLASVVSASWATRLLAGQVTLPSLAPALGALLAAVLVVGLGPLVLFAPLLVRLRLEGQQRYAALSCSYARQFAGRWLTDGTPGTDDPALLGSGDIEPLSEMYSIFAQVRSIRPLVFTRREVLQLAVAVVAPMVPLVFTVMSFSDLLGQVARSLLGAIAH